MPWTGWRRLWLLFLACASFSVATTLRAQDDDDEEFAPGLIARYAVGEQAVERIETDVAHRWDEAAPDPLLPAGSFTAEWNGRILVKSETDYVFHIHVDGAATVEIDGAPVVAGEASGGWISGQPRSLSFGFLKLRVNYRRTGAAGGLKLYWSSDRFPLEPLPPHLLFRSETRDDLALIDRGRILYDAHRCNRCHHREGEPESPPAPALAQVTTGLNPEWLEAKLLERHPEAAHARMPFFDFTEEEAHAIAEYLWHTAQPVQLARLPALKEDAKNPPSDGDLLIRSIGCLACHVLDGVGTSGPFGGGDLSQIGGKRTPEWLYTQLGQPTKVNVHHRMPAFRTTPTERAQIARALAGRGAADGMAYERDAGRRFDGDVVRRGRELAHAARCIACHKIPVADEHAGNVAPLHRPVEDWSKSCLAETVDRVKWRPIFRHTEREALTAYVITLAKGGGKPSPLSAVARGARILEERNCLACHERGLGQGIVSTAGKSAQQHQELFGQSQALIPPSLSAVGDKLQNQALAEAVVGGPASPRMPWLRVRMPRFEHSPEEKADLVASFIGHDRIPDDAPATGTPPRPEGSSDALLLAGRTLIGGAGFSCIACHEVGDYVPRNVAIATHGSNLLAMGSRIRREYFHRWTRSPLRIVPGMEMPAYERPVPGILDGTIDTQLAAIWEALLDPRFTPPTDPSVVEQLLVVEAGERPRVVRDVFTAAEGNGGGTVPRALAIGLGNGHSLLFDLDHAAIRGWTFGEFARQRTAGKSWYWDLAGADVASGLTDQPGIGLVAGGEPLSPAAVDGRSAKLLSYSSDGNRVTLHYDLAFPEGDGRKTVRIRETIAPWSDPAAGRSGWQREIASESSALRILAPEIQSLLGEARVTATVAEADNNRVWKVVYSAALARTPLSMKPREELPFNAAPVTTLPGFTGRRLRLSTSIMPTALAWRPDGTLAFTSLKGQVLLARDTDGDGVVDDMRVFEEGLAAPFGILADGGDLLVAHKPELVRLRDTDGDGRCDERIVVADGWGFTEDYHDWAFGPVRDRDGSLLVAVGSDYAHANRPEDQRKWRGKVLRIGTDGVTTPIAHELRYPVGIAFDPQGRLFVSDQQGVQNTFNEIDHIVPGRSYGVPAHADKGQEHVETRAAVQVPHPWTRSVNGIFFIPADAPGRLAPYAGHGIGCEYNGRFLMRFSLQEVGGELQGATYEFSRTTWDDETQTFLGPICGAVGPDGGLYVGSIHDSGWLGGRNTGEIVRLIPGETPAPNGIREVRAVKSGFEIEFLEPVDKGTATKPEHYSCSGYTRVWQGSYATPDSARYTPEIREIVLSDDGRTVTLHVAPLRDEFVYDIDCSGLAGEERPLFPSSAAYTMNRVPVE